MEVLDIFFFHLVLYYVWAFGAEAFVLYCYVCFSYALCV